MVSLHSIHSLRLFGLVIMAIGLVYGASAALADDDQDRARAAMLRGDVAPLSQALDVVDENFKGKVIEVELEEEEIKGRGEILIYEIKMLTPNGRVLELELDAKTLEILTVEGDESDDDKWNN